MQITFQPEPTYIETFVDGRTNRDYLPDGCVKIAMYFWDHRDAEISAEQLIKVSQKSRRQFKTYMALLRVIFNNYGFEIIGYHNRGTYRLVKKAKT